MDQQSAYRGFAIVRGDCSSSSAGAAGGGPPVPIVKTVPTPAKATPPPIVVRALPTKPPPPPPPPPPKPPATVDLYNNTNVDGVSNGPTGKTAFSLSCNAHIAQLVTYHWNNGRGATPGTIAIQSNQTGKIYGPFAAHGSSGQNNAPNVNWIADVSFDLPGGKGIAGLATYGYVVIDSDNATWSMNAKSAYRGFAIVRGACTGSSVAGSPGGPPPPMKVTPKPTPTATKKPTPPPIVLTLPTAPGKTAKISCYLNSGAAVPKLTPCKGPAGTVLGVFLPTTQHYTTMLFRAYGFPDESVPLGGSGPIRDGAAPKTLCVSLAPPKWSVYIEGPGLSPIGPVGGFSITGCSSKLPAVIPTPVPGTPPPGLASVKPCFVNTYAIASVGPCFGPANSKLAVRIYSNKYAPYALLQFKIVVANGVPALVTTPLVGSGNLLSANVPIQLCLAKSNSKWQVWLFNQTRSVGEIGEFTITGCP